jgi:dihydrofolate reductase
MRKLVVTENITLDGVVDASEGWFAPAGDEEVDQSDLNAALREQAEAADALLLGRVTFEEFRGYWPLQTDDETGVTEYRLFVYPVVLGRGARLFEDATGVPKLKLVDSRSFRSGVVLTSYSTDG